MTDQGYSMHAVWKLLTRARPHLRASELLSIGVTFQLHRRQALELAAAGLGELPDAELAQELLVVARRMRAVGAKP
jgi:hypothetical protein